MSRSEQFTKGFFWLAFSAFLAMSIPHVAYVFRFYEPKNDGHDIPWWGVSYGVAVGIDLLICWLSYTRGESKQSRGDAFITWLFIFLLAALSWYCNWLFAEMVIGVNIWSISLLWGWTVGTLTPLIVSAIPMFMIAYTYMSRKIVGTKPKTAEELAQEATRLEALEDAQKRIAQYQERTRKPSLIARAKETAKEAKAAFLEVRNGGVKLPEQAQYNERSEPPITEESTPSNDDVNQALQEQDTDRNTPDDNAILETVNRYPHIRSLLFSGRRTATIEQIMEATGHPKRRILNRLNDGTLKRAPRNAQLILISSVIEWLKTAPLPGQNGSNTGEIPAIQLVEKTG